MVYKDFIADNVDIYNAIERALICNLALAFGLNKSIILLNKIPSMHGYYYHLGLFT